MKGSNWSVFAVAGLIVASLVSYEMVNDKLESSKAFALGVINGEGANFEVVDFGDIRKQAEYTRGLVLGCEMAGGGTTEQCTNLVNILYK